MRWFLDRNNTLELFQQLIVIWHDFCLLQRIAESQPIVTTAEHMSQLAHSRPGTRYRISAGVAL